MEFLKRHALGMAVAGAAAALGAVYLWLPPKPPRRPEPEPTAQPAEDEEAPERAPAQPAEQPAGGTLWSLHPDDLLSTVHWSCPEALQAHTARVHLHRPAEFRLVRPADRDCFGVISYNVLLPNSVDGWWVYKYYAPGAEQTDWPARQALLEAQLLEAAAGVVCLQETSPESFDQDFSFLTSNGYLGAQHSKGRLRPATFWQQSQFECLESHSKDKVLITLLQSACGRLLYVVNCHLTAGHEPARRLRQVHQALETVTKSARRRGLQADPAVVLCGDHNSQGHTGVRQLLLTGEVSAEFEEDGQLLSSKAKQQRLGPFVDCFDGEARPPTMICHDLMDKMINPATGSLQPALCEALGRVFDKFADMNGLMAQPAVDKWLLAINKQLGRGSEYRKAIELMAGRTALTKEQFVSLYGSELAEGKYWGVEHDLALFGRGLAVQGAPPFAAVFDYVYINHGLELVGVWEPLSKAEQARVWEDGDRLPNKWHPSDHLPVRTLLQFT